MATTKCIPRRIGIVGFGSLGEYLYNELQQKGKEYEVVFVWNRTADKMKGKVLDHLILQDLAECGARRPDLIVEVAHPSVTAQFGPLFIKTADFLIGSPTALSDPVILQTITTAANSYNGVYIAIGALWGGHDIQRMADRGTLKGLKVTMKKHPSMLKVLGSLAEKNKEVKDTPTILYEGPVRDLCPLAPNNVNTMATASIFAHNLGFDGVIGCLVSDPSLTCHIVEVEVTGPGTGDNHFTVHTVRTNPASSGAVTGKQTYVSFFSSVTAACGRGLGLHLC